MTLSSTGNSVPSAPCRRVRWSSRGWNFRRRPGRGLRSFTLDPPSAGGRMHRPERSPELLDTGRSLRAFRPPLRGTEPESGRFRCRARRHEPRSCEEAEAQVVVPVVRLVPVAVRRPAVLRPLLFQLPPRITRCEPLDRSPADGFSTRRRKRQAETPAARVNATSAVARRLQLRPRRCVPASTLPLPGRAACGGSGPGCGGSAPDASGRRGSPGNPCRAAVRLRYGSGFRFQRQLVAPETRGFDLDALRKRSPVVGPQSAMSSM